MSDSKFRFWLILSILWIAVIYIFSAFSGEVSSTQSHAVWEVLHTIWPELAHSTVRSIAHCLEYAILGWFSLGMFFNTKSFKLSKPLLFCLLIALGDETLQLYITDRASEVLDIWLDFLGSFISCLIFWGIFSLRKDNTATATNTKK